MPGYRIAGALQECTKLKGAVFNQTLCSKFKGLGFRGYIGVGVLGT